MEKTILIAGKDLPDSLDLADGILMSGRNVVATTSKSSVIKNSISLSFSYCCFNNRQLKSLIYK